MLAKIEGVNYTAIIGESAKIDVKQAINYIKSGQAEISETVGDIIGEFNNNAVEKTNTFNQNAIDKTAEFNLNASNKTSTFNTNATNKTTNYNDNATSKTGVFDGNAVDKTNDFNLNASNKTTDFNNNYLEKKALIDTEVDKSKIWAEGTDGEVTPLGGTHSAKVWAEIAEDAASGVQNPANRDLSNLTTAGQKIIDSQNGTLSNYIVDIPQNIKLTLENNVLTLKAGSILTKTGSSYATVTTSADKTYTITGSSYRGVVFTAVAGGAIQGALNINTVGSGSSLPSDNTTYSYFFNTTDKKMYRYTGGSWVKWDVTYPVCLVDVDSNGVASFAKDSNGNDMIFNGAGFIGHHAFVYPNVKSLVPHGKENGKLKSSLYTTTGVSLVELGVTPFASVYERAILIKNNASINAYGEDVETFNELRTVNTLTQYCIEDNYRYKYTATTQQFNVDDRVAFVIYNYDGTDVTKFDIIQPYENVRNLLTDDLEEQIEQNTADIATKQVDVTTLTGYDATQTQTLKNVNGTLTWVTD